MGRILLLEANAQHADIIRQHLEKNDFDVLLNATISEAKKTLEQQLPDFLVIDLNLSEDTFLEFYWWVRESPGISEIPRLFIAGKIHAEMARKLKSEYNETVLEKPLDIRQFIQAIRQQKSQKTEILSREEEYISSLMGKKIGPAIVQKIIGRGGMGVVFLGYQESLNRQVAVKLLLPGMMGDTDITERFKREARATAQLKSPHIVQIFDFAEMKNHAFYIIMEYLPGETIETYLNRSGKFPLEKAVSVISQVARGLNVAHDAGLIHRDIKPSNLIMDTKGHVTITDFGLVKIQKSVKQTQTGMVFGTPQYISPEQTSGERQDPRSDIYSLGIVFYHLLTGNLPFISNSAIELMMKHLNEPLPDPRKITPSLPQRMVEILSRMTAKDPNDRYINCRELLWELETLDLKYTPAKSIPAEKKNGIPSPGIDKVAIDPALNQGFVELNKHFPSICVQEKLLGTMILSETGNILSQQGQVPERWKNILYILYESTKQLNAAAELGKWHFTISSTPEDVAALFPQKHILGTMVFNQEEATLSSQSFQIQSADLTTGQISAEPIKKIASIAGVINTLLFDVNGELVDTTIKDTAALEQYKLRFSPVTQIIHSIQFVITDIDIWFDNGRILVWKLETGMLFLITSLDISKSFLSIFVLTHLEQLNTLTQTAKLRQPVEKAPIHSPVDNPVSPQLLQNIQLELARMVGPIAKVLLTKEIKKMGYSKSNFPEDQLQELIKELTKGVDKSRRQQFIDNLHDLIYDFRRKK